MGRAIGLFSSKTITQKGLGATMTHLRATLEGEDGTIWILERENRRIYVELASDELDAIPLDIIHEVVEGLDDEIPKSMVSVIFNDSQEDRFEWRMARAVGVALAEHYPIVWHDYANEAEVLYAPGQRPISDDRPRRK